MTRGHYKKNTVLVTGAAGYIGSALLPVLVRQGYRVRAADALFYGNVGLRPLLHEIEFLKGDIREKAFCEKIMSGVQYVVHLAAITLAGKTYPPEETFAINAEGTKTLAHAAKRSGAEKFIFASSCSVYHRNPPYGKLMTEEDLLDPLGPYSRSKVTAEEELLRLADSSFCPVIFRMGTVFGVSPRMRYDLEMNGYCRDVFMKGEITVPDGDIHRPFLDIQDVVSIHGKALQESHRAGVYSVPGWNFVLKDVAKDIVAINKEMFGKDAHIEFEHPEVTRNYEVSDEKVKRDFGFAPQRSSRAVIQEILSDLSKRSNPYDSIYDNLEVFSTART